MCGRLVTKPTKRQLAGPGATLGLFALVRAILHIDRRTHKHKEANVSQEAATDAPNAADEEVEETGPVRTAFDPERAQATIAEQRKAEKSTEGPAEEMQDKLAAYTAAEEAKARS